MKIVVFILFIIILPIALMPCADGMVISANDMHSVEDSHDHSPEHPDHCSPFCICQCCGASISISKVESYILSKKSPSFSSSFKYTFDYSIEYSDGTWRPPALS